MDSAAETIGQHDGESSDSDDKEQLVQMRESANPADTGSQPATSDDLLIDGNGSDPSSMGQETAIDRQDVVVHDHSDLQPPTEPEAGISDGAHSVGRQPVQYALTAVAIVAIVLMVAYSIARSRISTKAKRWSRKLFENAAPRPEANVAQPSLRVQFKHHTHDLGPISQLRRTHIGSGANNTIKVDDRNVALRHARLFHRRGGLWVRNLSHHVMRANDQVVRRGPHRVTLPCELTLADGVTVALDLVQDPQGAIN